MMIDRTVQWVAIVLFCTGLLLLILAVVQFRAARKLPYFLLRKEGMMRGWRLALMALLCMACTPLVLTLGKRAAYVIIQPTPSATPSPTITMTPTITSTPTITDTPPATLTPTLTSTPTDTPTPQLPAEIKLLIRETQTPQPDAVFSPILVARRLNQQNEAVDPQDEFENPLGRLYGAFTYDNLSDGVRWTAVWVLGEDVFCIETQPWDGGTGGYGYTECAPERWLPGEYEIQIFYGEEWKVSARFEVIDGQPTTTPEGAT